MCRSKVLENYQNRLHSEGPIRKEKILKPSASEYINATELIVEVKSGDINNIKGSTIFQESNTILDVEESEGVVFDVNFLESIQIPERFFESGTSSQSGNIITVVSADHGLRNGNSVYIKFSEIDGEKYCVRERSKLKLAANRFAGFTLGTRGVGFSPRCCE